ncbi:hypothetical protein RRG08_016377 [Elysia crispata]|uniref:Uncharacterized protein n=1 Tax=Elysia crispata TaxID=231223 RepID=A0AAE1DXA4_9GAST|nr:hypothetical protein RRG08_016377 [Elysia crispata]
MRHRYLQKLRVKSVHSSQHLTSCTSQGKDRPGLIQISDQHRLPLDMSKPIRVQALRDGGVNFTLRWKKTLPQSAACPAPGSGMSW